MFHDGEGAGLLIWLALIGAAITALIMLLSIIIMIVGAVGVIVGLYYAIKCFILARLEVKEAAKLRKSTALYPPGTAPRNEDGKLQFYEDYAPTSYFNGQFQKDIRALIKGTWKNIGVTISEMKDNMAIADGWQKIASIVKNIVSMIMLIIFGSVVTAVLTAFIFIIGTLITIGYRIFYGIALLIDKAHYSSKKIANRCDSCLQEYQIPVYECPMCKVPHKSLRASKFGIFKRRCVCGEVLPCTSKGRSLGTQKLRIELDAICPFCGYRDESKGSRPLGVALIGGVGSGKSTFKTAFLYDFINEKSLKQNIKVSFPNNEAEQEFTMIERYFKGERAVPETRPGREKDVTSFNFFMDHDKFDVPRLLHIYDMPGEVFETDNAKERLDQFVFSEGAVFLVDPYTLRSVQGMGDRGSMVVGKMDIDNLVNIFLSTIDALPGMTKKGGKYTLPVAVCINKVDTPELKAMLGKPAIDKLMAAKPEVYKNEFDTMDYVCRMFLKDNDKDNMVLLLDQNFSDVHFFSCSSMGYVPKGALTRFQPEHVINAVHWILSRSDSQIRNVWNDLQINDISESQKKIWNENITDYTDIVQNPDGARI